MSHFAINMYYQKYVEIIFIDRFYDYKPSPLINLETNPL